MKRELYDKLVESIKEAGAIRRGEKDASRVFEKEPLDVIGIRAKFNITQKDFATMLGISTRTLQNWEQGRRTPDGPALRLLEVAAKHPEAVWDTVKPAVK